MVTSRLSRRGALVYPIDVDTSARPKTWPCKPKGMLSELLVPFVVMEEVGERVGARLGPTTRVQRVAPLRPMSRPGS